MLSQNQMVAMKKAIERTYDGVCRAVVQAADPVPDPETGRTGFIERELIVDTPCHLSFGSITTTVPDSGAQRVTQEVTLFIDPDVQIPPGAKLTITQNHRTGHYVQSGEPAVYASHQEIKLRLFERWA